MQTRHHVVSFKTSYHALGGMCGVSIFQTAPEMAVVVLSEYDENPGVSVTNAVEVIATKVKRAFLASVPHDQIIWVERYDKGGTRLVDDGTTASGETFDLVRMDWSDGTYRTPQWSSLGESRSAEDFWRTLFQSDRPLSEFPKFSQIDLVGIG